MHRRRSIGDGQPGERSGRERDACAGLHVHISAVFPDLYGGSVRADAQECAGEHADILHERAFPDVGPVAQIGVLNGPAAEHIHDAVVQCRAGHRRAGLHQDRAAVLRDRGRCCAVPGETERRPAGNGYAGCQRAFVKINPTFIVQHSIECFAAVQDADAAAHRAAVDDRVQQNSAFQHLDYAVFDDRRFGGGSAAEDPQPVIAESQTGRNAAAHLICSHRFIAFQFVFSINALIIYC